MFFSHLFLAIKLNIYFLSVIFLILYLLYYFGHKRPEVPSTILKKKQIPKTSNPSQHSNINPLTIQVQFTKRPLLYISRFSTLFLGNTQIKLLCGILFVCGF